MDKTIILLNSMTDKALYDGIITEDEKALLKSVFEDLNDYFSTSVFDCIEFRIPLSNPSKETRLKKLLIKILENARKTALEDGVVTDDERVLLDHLEKAFGIGENVQN